MNDSETKKPEDGTAAGQPAAPDTKTLEAEIVKALKTCYDPEIPVDIYELGLIYAVAVAEDRRVKIKMTLTSPMCPVAGSLPGEVQALVAGVPGVVGADVELVWDPPWDKEMMSEAARVELGFF